mmetsp:Transcript_12944/g.29415  ORF Transcript_12944/g.29415 Transcript_12944/m.29415 type:complete len:298 (-) Transcript_12944:72-965(-)
MLSSCCCCQVIDDDVLASVGQLPREAPKGIPRHVNDPRLPHAAFEWVPPGERSNQREILVVPAASRRPPRKWGDVPAPEATLSRVDQTLLEDPQELRYWTPRASMWRNVLRTCQSLVAMLLYGLFSFLRPPRAPLVTQFALVVCVAPLFSFLYHHLSLNKAGGYYGSFVEMFARLPHHFQEVYEQAASGQLSLQVEAERRANIVRMVDGLESGVVFVLLSFASLLVARRIPSALPRSLELSAEVLMYFLVHRALGASLFVGMTGGLLQPQAMWQFDCDPSGVECHMQPLELAQQSAQ